jgi:hypothetical protein
MILVYTDKLNPRIEYIFRLVFTGILQNEVSFTTRSIDFTKSELPKVNYSYEKFGDEIYIKPHRLLHCRALIQPDIQTVWYEGEKYFFDSSADSVFPFDPFAATFYLVTRYEEYLRFKGDRYGRFQPEDSILTKYGLMKKPVVDIWARMLASKLKERFPGLVFKDPSFRFLPTIDIDNAWAYSNKGFLRSMGAISKILFKGNFSEAGKRVRVLIGKEKDPYDTYDFLDETFRGYEDKVIYFFQVGDYSRYDKNISWKNRSFQKLIRNTSARYITGIHPSYASSKKRGKKKLASEIDRLFKITGIRAEKSRQHYLKLRFPRTYRRLEDLGVKEDYTMGYAAATGFRAGTCTPYYFYDLKRETPTHLMIIPFQVMDGTLNHYMKLKPEEAWKEIETLMTEVKSTGGVFVPVWHNETLAETPEWKGYREVFRKMIQKGFDWENEEQPKIFEPQEH